MTPLSKHFSLEEMTKTGTGLPNYPYPEALTNLQNTADRMEDVRTLLGHPIHIDSAFRSSAVNKAVRGVPTSSHCDGYAVDFTCPDFGTPQEVAQKIAKSDIKFDQLIREYGWVHISFDPRMRGQKLTKRSAADAYEIGINA